MRFQGQLLTHKAASHVAWVHPPAPAASHASVSHSAANQRSPPGGQRLLAVGKLLVPLHLVDQLLLELHTGKKQEEGSRRVKRAALAR